MPTSNYDEGEVKAFYMDLKKLYREDHTFFKVGGFNAKAGPRRTSEERHIETHRLERNEHETLELIRQRGIARAAGNRELTSELVKQCRQALKEDLKERRAAVMVEAAKPGKSIRKASQSFASYKTKMIALRRPDGIITASRKAMEKIVHEFYSNLLDNHAYLPSYEIKEDRYVVPLIGMNNIMNDLAPELSRRKRAAWGAFKSIEDVVKRTKNTRLRAHLFDSTVLPALTRMDDAGSLPFHASERREPNLRLALAIKNQRRCSIIQAVEDKVSHTGNAYERQLMDKSS
uniref:Uncharacterized protein n=1 Tax=Angiostrongylus cantonensis TaxID=6313 RepID=A0A0K0CXU0_ANGCA